MTLKQSEEFRDLKEAKRVGKAVHKQTIFAGNSLLSTDVTHFKMWNNSCMECKILKELSTLISL